MARSSSPDSSISIASLLASCSLGSSKGSSTSTSSIEYKDKPYDSATKALEAYIEDYEESLRSPSASTGRIAIRPTATPRSTRKTGTEDTTPPPKHVSRGRRVSRDPDLLSLTTDDLLGFPSDGSLPFSRVSDWKHYKKRSRHEPSIPNYTARPPPLTASLNRRASHHPLRHRSHSQDSWKLREELKENKANVLLELDRGNHPEYHNNLNSPYLLRGRYEIPKSYPRWLTSQKSELGVSGITSIPNVSYPVWIKEHGLLGHTDGHITKNLYTSSMPPLAHGPVRDIQDFSHSPRRAGKEAVNSGSPVSGKFYSGLSDLDALKHLHTPITGHLNDAPLRRSEVFKPSEKVFPEFLENNGSPKTEDVLEAERSWEQIPYSFKSPVPILCTEEINEEIVAPVTPRLVEDFLTNKIKEESKTSSFSGGNHHGPVEALKHMLFNLQTFQQNFTQTQTSEQVKEFHKVYTEVESEIQRADQEAFPVNKSLQKALQHLARLKELVGDDTAKQDQENKEEPINRL